MVNPVSASTQAHLITSIQWISKMSGSERWDLNDSEVAALLGRIPLETYLETLRKVERGLPIVLSAETIERLSLLLGIWKALQLLVPVERMDLAFAWFNKTNSSTFLQGMSIKDYLIENNSLESFHVVRDYLNSNR